MRLARFRQGFSLIEALVVLAVGGMALAIIFGIGISAGDAGFALGRRALSAADGDIANGDLRTIIRSLSISPVALRRPDDRQIVGEATRIEGEVVMERGTACAPQGWSGLLTLTVEGEGPTRALVCRGAREARLIPLPRGAPAFAYSTDGLAWTPRFSTLDQVADQDGTVRSTRLWVRFSAPPVVDIVETAASGRPELWIRRVDEF